MNDMSQNFPIIDLGRAGRKLAGVLRNAMGVDPIPTVFPRENMCPLLVLTSDTASGEEMRRILGPILDKAASSQPPISEAIVVMGEDEMEHAVGGAIALTLNPRRIAELTAHL